MAPVRLTVVNTWYKGAGLPSHPPMEGHAHPGADLFRRQHATLSSAFFAPLNWMVAGPAVSLKRTLLRMPGQVFTPLKAADFTAWPS